MKGTDVDEDSLPAGFQRGLEELRRQYPSREIAPVVEKGNFVVVSLDEIEVTGPQFEEDGDGRPLNHTYDAYQAFARLPRSFPTGKTYGFATAPPITREDRDVLNNDQIQKEVDEPLDEYVNGSVELYSWNWDGHPTEKPEHMRFAVDLAEAMLAHG